MRHLTTITLGREQSVSKLAFSPDGSRLFVALYVGGVLIYDTATAELLHHHVMRREQGLALGAFPDGSRLITGSKVLSVVSAQSGEGLGTLDCHKANKSYVCDVSVNAQGTLAWCASSGGDPDRKKKGDPDSLQLWDLSSLDMITSGAQGERIFSIALGPDESHLYVSSGHGYDEGQTTGAHLAKYEAHTLKLCWREPVPVWMANFVVSSQEDVIWGAGDSVGVFEGAKGAGVYTFDARTGEQLGHIKTAQRVMHIAHDPTQEEPAVLALLLPANSWKIPSVTSQVARFDPAGGRMLADPLELKGSQTVMAVASTGLVCVGSQATLHLVDAQ